MDTVILWDEHDDQYDEFIILVITRRSKTVEDVVEVTCSAVPHDWLFDLMPESCNGSCCLNEVREDKLTRRTIVEIMPEMKGAIERERLVRIETLFSSFTVEVL